MNYKYCTVVLESNGRTIEHIYHNDVGDMQEALEVLGIDTSNSIYQTYYASEINVRTRFLPEDPVQD